MTDLPLLLHLDPPVATVVFNRPRSRNALNEEMQRMLPPMLEDLRKKPGIRVLIFRGAGGKAFASGDDITQFIHWGAKEALAHYYHREAFLSAIETFPKPTIALIEGFIETYTYDLARKMACLAPLSLQVSKQTVHTCLENPELCGIAEPAALAASLCDTADFHRGVEAFLAKRTPEFQGR
jgi:enoyl-CoA hydratase/carnithine racemase